jgi:hypothetical protein
MTWRLGVKRRQALEQEAVISTGEPDPRLALNTDREIRDRLVTAPPIRGFPQQLIPSS